MADRERQRPARSKGRLEIVGGLGNARPFMHLVMNYLQRADQHRRAFYGGDLELAAVAETVGLVAIDAQSRKSEFRERFGDYNTVVGVAGQRPVNASTIAEATGIPRETVRRKLKLLLERGVIVEKTPGAYVMKPGFIQKPENLELVDRGMRDTLQFINDFIRLGLLRWVDEADQESR